MGEDEKGKIMVFGAAIGAFFIAGLVLGLLIGSELIPGYSDRDLAWKDSQASSKMALINVSVRVYDDSDTVQFTINRQGEHFTNHPIHGALDSSCCFGQGSHCITYRDFNVSAWVDV